jgi:carbon storage regulator
VPGYDCAVLVLTRKVGEQVLIGEDIVVTVLDVKGDSIKIGFDAPRGIKIQRAEMIAAVTAANQEAAAAATEAAEARLKALFPSVPKPAAPDAPSA